MLKNYLLSTFRSFTKQKFYMLLNLGGLILGLTAAIFILLYVYDELQYDKHHKDHEQIYRVNSHFRIGDMDDRFAIAAVPVGPAFKLEFPEVETMTRLTPAGQLLLIPEVGEYYEDDIFFADSTVFELFSHEFIYGNPQTALNEINAIVLTRSLAEKLFGSDNPMGKVMRSGLNVPLKVTAVIEDMPLNSHMRYDGLVSLITAAGGNIEQLNSFEAGAFWNIGVYTFVKLHPMADPKAIDEKFPAFYEKYMQSVGEQINATFKPELMPIAAIHLKSKYQSDFPTGNIAYVYIFSAVGIFILFLAIINYMNLATARSSRRSREVGIRKVAGASRSQLITQFFVESFSLVILASLFSILLVELLLPAFNELAGKETSLKVLLQLQPALILAGIIMITGFASGSYPALFLSSFKPVAVLKGGIFKGGKNAGVFRRILVVTQFTIATALIIGTFVVNDQLTYLQQKDLGFEKEGLIVLQLQDTSFRNRLEPFRQDLLQHPAIKGVTNANGIPGETSMKLVMQLESEEGWQNQAVMLTMTDYHYLDVLGLRLLEGRNFDQEMTTDVQEAAIVNHAFIRQFGWEDAPLGKQILFGVDENGQGGRRLRVIGVVADFHFQSLHNPIEPYLILLSERPRHLVTIRYTESQMPQVIEHLQLQWDRYASGKPFSYRLQDQILSESYKQEGRIARLFGLAAIFTILVALLGLLGLTSFMAEQRTKEVGIRKILGASDMQLMRLLFSELLVLIVIAFVFAVPLAWWRLDIWLESSFEYHTVIHWYFFIMAALLTLFAGIFTMSFHLIKAIRNNPVEAVKYE